MPPGNIQYAMAAANLIMENARIRSMADYNRSAAITDAVRRIPGGIAGIMQARDQRAAQAQQAQIRDMQIRQAERDEQRDMKEFADEQAIQDIFKLTPRTASGGMDYGRVADEVATIDPIRAEQVRQIDDAAKNRAQRELRAKTEKIANALFDVKDQAGWDRAINTLAKQGIDAAKDLPRQFDPEFRDTVLRDALGTRDWLDLTSKPAPKTRTIKWRKPDGTEVEEVIEDVIGTTRESAPVPKTEKPDLDADIYAAYKAGNVPEYRRLLRVKADMSAAGRAPSSGGGDEVTQAQRNTAERWKFTQLKALEDAYGASKASGTDMSGLSPEAQAILASMRGGGGKAAMSDQELYRRKLEIENTYRRQINLQPLNELPSSWGNVGRPGGQKTPSAQPPAGTTTQAAQPAPAAQPQPAPAAPTNATPKPKERRTIDGVLAEWDVDPADGKYKWLEVVEGATPAAAAAPAASSTPKQEPKPAPAAQPKATPESPAKPAAPAKPATPSRASQVAASASRTMSDFGKKASEGAREVASGPAVKTMANAAGAVAALVRSGAEAVQQARVSPNATKRAIDNIAADARIHGGRDKLATYVETNRRKLTNAGVDVNAYLNAIRKKA